MPQMHPDGLAGNLWRTALVCAINTIDLQEGSVRSADGEPETAGPTKPWVRSSGPNPTIGPKEWATEVTGPAWTLVQDDGPPKWAFINLNRGKETIVIVEARHKELKSKR
jgi:hypothetical protein